MMHDQKLHTRFKSLTGIVPPTKSYWSPNSIGAAVPLVSDAGNILPWPDYVQTHA